MPERSGSADKSANESEDVLRQFRQAEGEARSMERPSVSSRPRSGRTIHVSPKMTPARAMTSVGQLVNLERIRQTSAAQRFHERRGLRVKRLRSERWARKFKQGFVGTVKRVQELARQGW